MTENTTKPTSPDISWGVITETADGGFNGDTLSWVSLTVAEIYEAERIAHNNHFKCLNYLEDHKVRTSDELQFAWHFAREIDNKLREKNGGAS